MKLWRGMQLVAMGATAIAVTALAFYWSIKTNGPQQTLAEFDAMGLGMMIAIGAFTLLGSLLLGLLWLAVSIRRRAQNPRSTP